jgi:proline dehydrogenase
VPVAFATGAALTTYGRRTEEDPATARSNIASIPTTDLVRAYLVYTVCGMPAVVDAAPALLDAFSKSRVPGVAAITNAVIRRTFFSQFVAGEDLPETMETISHMNARGIGGLLNYGAEAELGDGLADDKHILHEHNYRQNMYAIEALGEHERRVAEAGGKTGSSQFAVKIVSVWEAVA